MKKTLLLLLLVFTCGIRVFTQSYESLTKLEGRKIDVYYSEGAKEKAIKTTLRVEKAQDYFYNLIGFLPEVSVLVLNPEDWPENYVPYGMPHITGKALVVASQDNEHWRSVIPPMDQLPAELAARVGTAYSDEKGVLAMDTFFDMLAIHELGHAYHIQAGLTMHRNWMKELFANIFLHTYIAENEPEQLPVLATGLEMILSGNHIDLNYTTLSDFESNYRKIAMEYPQNYGWYQIRLTAAAGDVYDAAGVEAFKRLWRALEDQKEILNDAELADFLSGKVHPSVADVLLKWDEK